MPLYKSLIFWILLLVSSSSNLALSCAINLSPEMPANFTPYLVQITYIALAWILYPLKFSPLSLIQKTKHSSSNQGLFCLNSSELRLSFAEVFIFSLNCNTYINIYIYIYMCVCVCVCVFGCKLSLVKIWNSEYYYYYYANSEARQSNVVWCIQELGGSRNKQLWRQPQQQKQTADS